MVDNEVKLIKPSPSAGSVPFKMTGDVVMKTPAKKSPTPTALLAQAPFSKKPRNNLLCQWFNIQKLPNGRFLVTCKN